MSTQLESVAKVLIVDHQQRALVLTVGEHLQSPEKSFRPDLPGGLVESDEYEKEGAIRETQEEAGIDLLPENVRLTYAKTEFLKEEDKSVSKFLYVVVLDETPDVILSWEHSAYEWVPVKDLLESVAFRPFWREAIEYSMKRGLIR